MKKEYFKWGKEEIKFKHISTEEFTVGTIIKFFVPVMMSISVITAIVFQSALLFLVEILFVMIFCVVLLLLSYIDKHKDKVVQDLKSKRTNCIQAKVVKIQYEEEADYDYVRIVCTSVSENGKERIFKTRKVLGRAICKQGDYIDVIVDPNNLDNYEIDITKCIE